jgi:FkbM family methyltransferase
MKAAVKSLLASFDIDIVRKSTFHRLYERSEAAYELDFLHAFPVEDAARMFRYLPLSKSQLRQDLFALASLGFKEAGYFVEFGATDGVKLSNTHLLEKHFGWTGILAEPGRTWREALQANRTAIIDTRCVWSTSGATLTFNEVDAAELSTISTFGRDDGHRAARRRGRQYEVETISLNDLLAAHNAPPDIDYLSIDTEGSEYDILQAVDFDRYRFKVITCEHNHTTSRQKIFGLLTSRGYRRVMEQVSRWDDWYVLGDTGTVA